MMPLDGEVREGVGLLGSPCFEIPRSVERDSRFDHLRTGRSCASRLDRQELVQPADHRAVPAARWLHVFLVTVFVLATVGFLRRGPRSC